jgi:hypothetical protein
MVDTFGLKITILVNLKFSYEIWPENLTKNFKNNGGYIWLENYNFVKSKIFI